MSIVQYPVRSTDLPHNLARDPARVPKKTRVYAIGDIHGRLDLLDQLLKTITKDSADAPKRKVLVVLGDVIDRGPDSAGVVARLSTLHTQPPFDGFKLHFLKGNHEQVMEAFLSGADDGRLWLKNGGIQTLESYGVFKSDRTTEAYRTDALAHVPAPHRQFFENMKVMHREKDYAFVHAGVRPGVALDQQKAEDLLWIRTRFLEARDDFGAVVVHGHSPVCVPDVLDNRIAIDTRAWSSGTLTCLVLQNDERRFLST
jgi:serine/threonine protein phosphatase 1